jgi:hypothetical protein
LFWLAMIYFSGLHKYFIEKTTVSIIKATKNVNKLEKE